MLHVAVFGKELLWPSDEPQILLPFFSGNYIQNLIIFLYFCHYCIPNHLICTNKNIFMPTYLYIEPCFQNIKKIILALNKQLRKLFVVLYLRTWSCPLSYSGLIKWEVNYIYYCMLWHTTSLIHIDYLYIAIY